jgi:hypothetical protein
VTVHIELPGGPQGGTDLQNVCVVRGNTTYLSQTALRGWVLTATGLGIAGATISVGGVDSTGGDDGSWFFYFPLNQPQTAVDNVDITVQLADGRSQTVNGQRIQRRATVVVPTFRF